MRAAPARLVHADDSLPGLRRERAGAGFRYRDASGARVRDPSVITRIEAIVIPPAWTDVWICPDPRGHVQATGRDAKGRKQYRYHPEWSRRRSEDKYARMALVGRVLPRIRRRVTRDLALRGLPREKVLALVVRLIETACVRVGNEEYARENGSRGLTTLLDGHARDAGAGVRLVFRGKSGVAHDVAITDRRLARLVRRCRELPGQQLFQYVDGRGRVRDVTSDDVNRYIRDASGADLTAKAFRTWAGTCLAAEALLKRAEASRRVEVAVVKEVAERLRNRPATCRKHYIHPLVFEAHASGGLARAAELAPPRRGLRRVECAVLALLTTQPPSRALGL